MMFSVFASGGSGKASTSSQYYGSQFNRENRKGGEMKHGYRYDIRKIRKDGKS